MIGIGINLVGAAGARPAGDGAGCAGLQPSRNVLVARLVERPGAVLGGFASGGFAAVHAGLSGTGLCCAVAPARQRRARPARGVACRRGCARCPVGARGRRPSALRQRRGDGARGMILLIVDRQFTPEVGPWDGRPCTPGRRWITPRRWRLQLARSGASCRRLDGAGRVGRARRPGRTRWPPRWCYCGRAAELAQKPRHRLRRHQRLTQCRRRWVWTASSRIARHAAGRRCVLASVGTALTLDALAADGRHLVG